tara:strand:- start:756 stop:1355 length:600 start_codon:yes stop_codon:yes gene_type:complete
MICIDDCPEKALGYKFKNPINDYDKINLLDFAYQKTSYLNKKIKSKFISVRDKDFFIIPFCLVFGLLLDGLFHFGHMLAFGVSSIISLIIFNSKISLSLRKPIFIFAICFMFFNGFLKFSQYQAMNFYEQRNFEKAVPYFENLVNYYPMEIGKYHAYLGVCFLEIKDLENSWKHYEIAQKIIPDNRNIIQLGYILESMR